MWQTSLADVDVVDAGDAVPRAWLDVGRWTHVLLHGGTKQFNTWHISLSAHGGVQSGGGIAADVGSGSAGHPSVCGWASQYSSIDWPVALQKSTFTGWKRKSTDV